MKRSLREKDVLSRAGQNLYSHQAANVCGITHHILFDAGQGGIRVVIFVVAGRTTAPSRGVVRWRTRCLVVDADGIAPHVMHQGIVLATDLPDMIEGEL